MTSQSGASLLELLAVFAVLGLGILGAQCSVHHGAEAMASVLLSSPVHAHAAHLGPTFHLTHE